MIHDIKYRNSTIRYSDFGKGPVLVFLHGYLLTHEVWKDFARPLTDEFRVIRIDLPGHGNSGLLNQVSTMEVMAGCVEIVMSYLEINKAVFFGHSMGGYAALALLEKRPDLFAGISLFHSHTLADSKEVKEKRDREVKLVEEGHKNLLVSQSVPNMFASSRLSEHQSQLKFCIQLAKEMDNQAVKAAILGLKARPDRSDVLAQAPCPCLQIIGRLDNFISYDEVSMKTVLPLGSERLIAEKSGHMGFFEEPDFIREGIRQFLKRIL